MGQIPSASGTIADALPLWDAGVGLEQTLRVTPIE